MRHGLHPWQHARRVCTGCTTYRLYCRLYYRPLQDVLVVTAPGSGAEVIPFLKTLDLPLAVAFTITYTTVRQGLGGGGGAGSREPTSVWAGEGEGVGWRGTRGRT